MDPLTDFLQSYGPAQKTAESRLGRIAGAFPEQLGQGAATAGAGALIVGAGVAANAIYGAITKSRDFRRMLAFNEDLAQQHKQNPKYINAAFSTLHRVNRQFAGDPGPAGQCLVAEARRDHQCARGQQQGECEPAHRA